ncbi:HAL protein kinase [Fusarium oxysporum f. sp. lycopersici 4287]|uniref:non-specific serine/threonine protein kinase n=2 Tax=Fusarium oxysporum f. sp. lycopersici (strain 4287 / CBS 123668 / FGSC 9935 / NRRL 34936) TaxID=426428 RepID=A0A0J9V0T4_FUSO4|nr:HAL protein kinase [Fusarium oxysporum f. sp. lycopersici 4287]XP_018242532.1 HAL protein kinase [Fusarium oxysporum f. sp. lycopersici 4287]KAJ9419338.1 HAL protein kinase [Fusarium oxysporum]KNB04486.1 HAL protein kinase [Fusarium oxysporum f. sp. lycopersici 4287]KNB04487.1 HAL protein kinase [Fusarium oxysporum f. sp. lycopersici 4287]
MESLRNIAKLRRLQHNATATTNLEVEGSTVQPSNSSAEPAPDTRKAVSTDMNADEAPLIPNLTNFDGSNTAPLQRFIALQEGHGHRIEQKLRKRSLFDRWRKILSKKQPQEDNKGPILSAKYGRCQEVVGYGASGIVHVSRKKKENGIGEELYAVKELQRRSRETEDEYIRRLTAEFCVLSELRHPNVIRTLELLTDEKGNYCQVIEYCEGGDLFTLVYSAGKLEVEEADCFFKQLMRGIEYLHEMGVAHRDLKPENLLLTRHGSLKISDFGNSDCFRMAWENDVHLMSGLCGSGPYIAPEVYTDQEYDGRAVDVWACGVIYIVMRTGSYLWHQARKDQDEIYAHYLKDRRQEEGFSPIESLNPSNCRDIIYCMLDPNPLRRITASQVLRSQWGQNIQLCQAAF